MQTLSFRALGTAVQLLVDGSIGRDHQQMQLDMDQAVARITELEARLSRFRTTSDISVVNRHPGQPVQVHADTLTILRIAEAAYRRTAGWFNPCLGHVLDNIGYDQSFETLATRTVPLEVRLLTPWVAPLHWPVDIDDDAGTVLLQPGCKLDLGGIAKGWIVEQAAARLLRLGYANFLCDAGGDMVCYGRNGADEWSVGIANPTATEETILTLQVENLAVATSGIYRRRWQHDGVTMHHLIDPFLGRPANTDLVSCTVVHASLAQAEVLAKVSVLLGVAGAHRWLSQQAPAAWVMVTNTGEVVRSWN